MLIHKEHDLQFLSLQIRVSSFSYFRLCRPDEFIEMVPENGKSLHAEMLNKQNEEEFLKIQQIQQK